MPQSRKRSPHYLADAYWSTAVVITSAYGRDERPDLRLGKCQGMAKWLIVQINPPGSQSQGEGPEDHDSGIARPTITLHRVCDAVFSHRFAIRIEAGGGDVGAHNHDWKDRALRASDQWIRILKFPGYEV